MDQFMGRNALKVSSLISLFQKSVILLLMAVPWAVELQAATHQTNSPPPYVYVRPGGTSRTWEFGTGTTPNTNYPGPHPVTSVGYYNVPAFGWYVTRGYFQYSDNGGSSWTTYTVGTSPTYIANPDNIWRFVDTTSSASPSTNNSFGCSWNLLSAGSSVSSGGSIIIDNPPTNIVSDKSVLLSGSPQGSTVATLTPGDTGASRDGYWQLESQSVPNLFALTFDSSSGNSASLTLGTGTPPSTGQTATVTVRYYDLYQTDDTGVPIAGQGTNKTLTFTVVAESTSDLNFSDDLYVNTYTNDSQRYAAVAKLSDGSFVVVWQSGGQDGKIDSSYNGIYGQRYTSTGTKLGGEFQVSNAGSNVDEILPAITPLNDGRYAVSYATWRGSDYDIGLRIVESNGVVGSEVIANSTTSGDQGLPSMATLTNGSIVIVWGSGSGNIVLRQFSPVNGSAQTSETTLVSGTGYYPGVAALSDGNYAVTWVDGNDYEVYVKVGSGGSPVDTGISWSYYGIAPKIAGLTSGFVVAGENYNLDTYLSEIEAVRYNNSGVIQGSLFHVNTFTNGNYYAATVAPLSGGGFVIGWVSDTDDYDQSGVYGRRYDAAGTAVDATEFEINQHRTGDQAEPAVTGLDGDLFAAAWTDAQSPDFNRNIEARVLLPSVSNVAPTFVGSTTNLTVNQDAGATDIKSLLHVSDTDSSQTLTWSESSAPAHGTLAFSSATASSGNTNITPGGTITYTPTSGYTGSDDFAVQVSDGTDTGTRTISVTVQDVTPPDAPTSFTAVVTGSDVLLTWTNPVDADFASVTIRRSASSFPTNVTDGSLVAQGLTGTSQADNSLSDGAYYYSIFARDNTGNWSAAANASATVDTTPPSAPTSFTAVATNNAVSLTWINPVEADFDFTMIRRSTTAYPTNVSDGTQVATGIIATSQADSSLSDGTYYYSIFARDTNGNWSAAANASATVDTTPPSAPSSFAGTSSGHNVSLTWVNPVDADFASTTIRRSTTAYPTNVTDGVLVAQGVTGTSQADNSLSDGTYYYAIFARDTVGNWSVAATVTVEVGPPVISTGPASVVYTLYQAPVLLASSGTFAAPSSPSFNGGTLTLTIVSNHEPTDILGLTNGGLFAATSNSVSYNSTQFGTYTGGTTGTTAIVFTFDNNASATAIGSLLNHLTFAVDSENYDITNFTRSVRFDFSDGGGLDSVPVHLEVIINRAPFAIRDRVSTGTNLSCTITFAHLLKNDVDPDGDPISLMAVDAAGLQGGTVVSNATDLVYTPPADFHGLDHFTYAIGDDRGGLTVGTVEVPVLLPDEISLDEAPHSWGLQADPSSLGIMGVPGNSYRLLATDVITNAMTAWVPIETNTLPPGGFTRFYDNDATNHPIRFYRAVTP